MKGYIDNYNFSEMNAMKYYAPPASWSDQKKKSNVKDKIYSGLWLGAIKKDGFFTKIVKDEDGNVLMYSRSRNVNGEYVDKHEWVPQLNEFFHDLANGTCLLGELYFPDTPGSKNVQTALGCLKEKAVARQVNNPLHFYVFDILAHDGRSLLSTKAKDRFVLVEQMQMRHGNYNGLVEWAKYYSGRDLWEQLQFSLARGEEGMVILHQDGLYEPDKRPSKTTLKVKQELKQTIDCFVIGFNPPTKLYGGKEIETWTYWVSSINAQRLDIGEHFKEYSLGATIVPVTKKFYNNWPGSFQLGLMRDGKEVYFGDISGLTDNELANAPEYLGKVCEISGMMIDEISGHIRHPRLMAWRDDKSKEECNWSQLQ